MCKLISLVHPVPRPLGFVHLTPLWVQFFQMFWRSEKYTSSKFLKVYHFWSNFSSFCFINHNPSEFRTCQVCSNFSYNSEVNEKYPTSIFNCAIVTKTQEIPKELLPWYFYIFFFHAIFSELGLYKFYLIKRNRTEKEGSKKTLFCSQKSRILSGFSHW